VTDDVRQPSRERIAARATEAHRELEQSDHFIVPLRAAGGAARSCDTFEFHADTSGLTDEA
jgi:hypothetical protein